MASKADREALQAQIKAQGEVVRKLKQEKRPQEEVCISTQWSGYLGLFNLPQA